MKDELNGKVTELVTKIKEKYLDSIELELTELKIKIYTHVENIEFEPRNIDEYLEKIKEIEEFSEKMVEYNQRLKVFDEMEYFM